MNEFDESLVAGKKEGSNAKCLKVLLNLYSITNDNITLLDGRLDLSYTTYYHVVVLCTVKNLIFIYLKDTISLPNILCLIFCEVHSEAKNGFSVGMDEWFMKPGCTQ